MASAPHEKICVALDVPERETAVALAKSLRDHVGMVKIGLEGFVAHGPDLVREIIDAGLEVFLDLKVHDIPRTAAAAAAAASGLGAKLLTIHAAGGAPMVAAGQILRRQDFTIDHIVPRSKGGQNTWSNTACACPPCNQRKGDRDPHEAGMTMLWEPKMPRVDYVVASGEVPQAWKIYLEA